MSRSVLNNDVIHFSVYDEYWDDHLDVLDGKVLRVKILVLGVALGVLEQVQEDLAGLHWPSAYRLAQCIFT